MTQKSLPCAGFGQSHNEKRYTHPSVHCSTVYNKQDREEIYMFISKGMD